MENSCVIYPVSCLRLSVFIYFFHYLFLSELPKHGGTYHIVEVQCWLFGKREEEKKEERVDTVYYQSRWVRQRMNVWHRPASSLRTLSRHPPVKELCRPSVSCAGSWSWILWTTAASTPHWRLQSPLGKSRPYGPNWTKGHNKRSSTTIKPARAPG